MRTTQRLLFGLAFCALVLAVSAGPQQSIQPAGNEKKQDESVGLSSDENENKRLTSLFNEADDEGLKPMQKSISLQRYKSPEELEREKAQSSQQTAGDPDEQYQKTPDEPAQPSLAPLPSSKVQGVVKDTTKSPDRQWMHTQWHGKVEFDKFVNSNPMNQDQQHSFPVPFDSFAKYDTDKSGELNYKEFQQLMTLMQNHFEFPEGAEETSYTVTIEALSSIDKDVFVQFVGPVEQKTKEVLLVKGGLKVGAHTIQIKAQDVGLVAGIRIRLGGHLNIEDAWRISRITVGSHSHFTESPQGEIMMVEVKTVPLASPQYHLDDSLKYQAQGADVNDAWTKKHYKEYQEHVSEYLNWVETHLREQREHNKQVLSNVETLKKAHYAEQSAEREAELIRKAQAKKGEKEGEKQTNAQHPSTPKTQKPLPPAPKNEAGQTQQKQPTTQVPKTEKKREKTPDEVSAEKKAAHAAKAIADQKAWEFQQRKQEALKLKAQNSALDKLISTGKQVKSEHEEMEKEAAQRKAEWEIREGSRAAPPTPEMIKAERKRDVERDQHPKQTLGNFSEEDIKKSRPLAGVLDNKVPSSHKQDNSFGHLRKEHQPAVEWAGRVPPSSPFAADYPWSYALGGQDWLGVCKSGHRQSPIVLSEAKASRSNGLINGGDTALELHYTATAPKSLYIDVTEHGLEIQANGKLGYAALGTNKTRYDVSFVSFHSPSEHGMVGAPRTDGRFDMEMQIFHTKEDVIGTSPRHPDDLLAVSILFQLKREDNLFLNDALDWENLPQGTGKHKLISTMVDLSKATSEDDWKSPFYSYLGSLTTPPCSEVVTWRVMKKPVDISPTQLKKITRLFEKNLDFANGNGNNRNFQTVGDRPGFFTLSV